MIDSSPIMISHNAFIAFAVLLFCGAMMALVIRQVSANSRRTALAVLCIVLLVSTVVASMFFGHSLDTPHLFAIASGLIAVAGLADRARPAALVLGGVLTVIGMVRVAMPLQQLFAASLHPAMMVFGACILAGAAYSCLLMQMVAHPSRFTDTGAWRLPRSGQGGHQDVLIGLSLAVALAMLAHIDTYTALAACAASSLGATCTARLRCHPLSLQPMALALPAGIFVAASCPHAGALFLMVSAALAGASIIFAREALVALRLDDPSGVASILFIPAVFGWLAQGFEQPSQLAASLHLLGFWLACGALLGVSIGYTARLLSGLTISDRLLEDGMDAKFAAP